MTYFQQPRAWTRAGGYTVSTDASFILPEASALNAMFASTDMFWAKVIPEEHLGSMLANSLNFGLYGKRPSEQSLPDDNATVINNNQGPHPGILIGFARCITDYTTFLYLTDVHILPLYRGKGLGAWLISCVQEAVEAIPHLRRSMLLTSDWKLAVPMYERLMNMEVYENKEGLNGREGLAVMFGMPKEEKLAATLP